MRSILGDLLNPRDLACSPRYSPDIPAEGLVEGRDRPRVLRPSFYAARPDATMGRRNQPADQGRGPALQLTRRCSLGPWSQ